MSLQTKLAELRIHGRKVWSLSLPYFQSENKWRARAMLAAIVLLNLGSVYMVVLLNGWNRDFYNALQDKDVAVFWTQLGRFTYIAFSYMVIAVYKFYLTQLFEIRWRAWMTDHYLQRWLASHAFYQLELMRFAPGNEAPDNPDQRIQEDISQFTTYAVSLSMGLLNAVVTLASFIGILWGLSGGFTVSLSGSVYEIPGFMVWLAIAYALAGSVITHYVARKLIPLNFAQQRFEADFRHHLVRVREYSEPIALDGGEAVELRSLRARFGKVLNNYLAMLRVQKNYTWFTSGYGQAAVIFPFLVAAPRFFSGAIQLGELMQISSAFGQVQDALSWFVNNYDQLAGWQATTRRLHGFEESVANANRPHDALDSSLSDAPGAALDASGLSVSLPGGIALLSGLALHAAAGDSVLLKGPSGSGKSTLFRTFAGIWPFASGKLERPADAMFIPQRPYFPNGKLRDALAYPEESARYSDEALIAALNEALLPALAQRLDDEDAWGQKLSGGEQQRLAIARVLLKKPLWVFADEATSALDEVTEQALYDRLAASVHARNGALVSIAHRQSVAAHHTRRWELVRQPEGAPARYALKETLG